MNNQPIGIFDSGIGGLTVAGAIWEKLPQESLIYLGDTARVPYGTRGKEVIRQFSLQLAKFLLHRQVKMLVVACNTISATCLRDIQRLTPLPIIDAITPVVEEAVKNTQVKSIGVIGTKVTIQSRVYEKEIKLLDPKIKVFSTACPLFVPIAEEGLSHHPVAHLMAKDYLQCFLETSIDTLILGCTHYPLLKAAIRKSLNPNITIIDSAAPIAKVTKKVLEEKRILNGKSVPSYEFFVTDDPERVKKTAERFFGGSLPGKIEKISLDESN